MQLAVGFTASQGGRVKAEVMASKVQFRGIESECVCVIRQSGFIDKKGQSVGIGSQSKHNNSV